MQAGRDVGGAGRLEVGEHGQDRPQLRPPAAGRDAGADGERRIDLDEVCV